MPARLLIISGVLAFLFLHTPFPLVLALGFYCIIWLAERLYHLIIALAKVACFAYIAFLLFQSLSLYIPPEIPMVGRKDELWLNHSQLFAVTSILAGS
ncbi:hypothetical protein FRC04_001612 [Tulasnella sp. 424]|nr:hypothetical protein FRC04_001612 [Tulasnella sp. 424]